MTRLAVPIVIVLLMLAAGAAWLIAVNLNPELASKPPAETSPATAERQPSAPDQPVSDSLSAETPGPAGESNASFDVARIDPQGTSVFAGQAEPGSTVTILGDGQPVATAEADDNGEWTVATDHAFASAEPKLALSVKSAAETKAAKEKAAEAKVAGSLETREPAKEEPKRQTAGTVASDLLKNFEGIVAAARDEAEQEKKQADEKKAASEDKAEPETVTEPKVEAKVEAKAETERKAEATTTVPEPTVPEPEISKPAPSATTQPAQEKEQEAKVAVAEPAQPPSPPESRPNEAATAPKQNDMPAEQSATPPSTPSATRLAATGPEKPPTPTAKSIPVPITFVFNEATFTDEGRKAVALLLEYLQIKRFGRVSLTGHADERGTETLNMNLSRERLDAVAEFLKDGGFDGKLELIPKGETEPFTGVDRRGYSKEELYQLDRRVELITTP